MGDIIKYIVYKKVLGNVYTRTEMVIKTALPLKVGKFITYVQYGIDKANVDKCVYSSNEFRVYLTIK